MAEMKPCVIEMFFRAKLPRGFTVTNSGSIYNVVGFKLPRLMACPDAIAPVPVTVTAPEAPPLNPIMLEAPDDRIVPLFATLIDPPEVGETSASVPTAAIH